MQPSGCERTVVLALKKYNQFLKKPKPSSFLFQLFGGAI